MDPHFYKELEAQWWCPVVIPNGIFVLVFLLPFEKVNRLDGRNSTKSDFINKYFLLFFMWFSLKFF